MWVLGVKKICDYNKIKIMATILEFLRDTGVRGTHLAFITPPVL